MDTDFNRMKSLFFENIGQYLVTTHIGLPNILTHVKTDLGGAKYSFNDDRCAPQNK